MVSQNTMASPGSGTSVAPCSASHTRASPPSWGVVEDLAQRGLRLGSQQRERLLAHQAPPGGVLVVAARRGQQLAGGVQRRPPPQPQLRLGVGRGRGVSGQRVEQGVRPLVGEVADQRHVDARVQHPGADREEAERGEGHHAVAGDVLLLRHVGDHPVDGLADVALAVDLLDERLVDGLVGQQAGRREHPELVVQAHHRVRDLFEDVVRRLVHVVRDDHGGGERGKRHGPLRRTLAHGGQQVEVAEDAVEEVRLLLRVPVERVDVELALDRGELVGEFAQVRRGGVGQDGLQARPATAPGRPAGCRR
ncbi:hypothetical protein GCM10020000_62200 [Streptomyces olivoverticillatus]